MRGIEGSSHPFRTLGATITVGSQMRKPVVMALVLGGPLAACGLTSSPPVASNPEPPIVLRPQTPRTSRAVAPLVAPGCAERIVRHGDDASVESVHQDGERHRSVAFRNRCGFPIRVLYAVRANGRLTELTERLAVDETSKFTKIEDGLDQPGYVVCSYEAVPASYACRYGR